MIYTQHSMSDTKKIGRPSLYSQELADRICAELSEGKSMRTVCKDESMPCLSTVFKWIRENEIFLQQYVRAKENSADAQHEMLNDIGDEAIEEVRISTLDPKAKNALVNAYKLKADNLKWSMSKMKPKKYGDKLDLTTKGERITQTPAIISEIESRNTKNNPKKGDSE